ncbi:MAG: anthranilate phosphoribosyltransferase [Gammaproteobacteria bacterium]|nr:anthranilate phosphoribosyltransferase [Gammaproteobacteria bacterium]
MRSIIQRIATGPELSKDISYEQARAGMTLVLDGRVDPVQAGIFLIALRMKRESDDELRGLLDALRAATQTVVADVDELIDIGDPYDGYGRSLPVAPFLPAVLAACGVPAISHGAESMGPKYGVTHRQVLRAAGLPFDLSMADAVARVRDPQIGWAYVDQRVFCPKLHALTPLRDLIVKRPALTTLEGLAGPIRARRRTHVLSGFVHKAYPRIYALLARHAGFESALIVRGIEGGVIPTLREQGRFFYYRDGGAEQEQIIMPADFGFANGLQAPALPGTTTENSAPIDAVTVAKAAADTGRRALAGEPGPARDGLILAAALCLWQLQRQPSLRAAADAVREVLDNGNAVKRLAA